MYRAFYQKLIKVESGFKLYISCMAKVYNEELG